MTLNFEQLRGVRRQFDELQQRLQEPETWEKPELFGKLQREIQELDPLAEKIADWEKNGQALAEAELMLQDDELRELAEEEKRTLLQQRPLLSRPACPARSNCHESPGNPARRSPV